MSGSIQTGDIYVMPLTPDDDITPKGGYLSRRKYCFVIGCSEYGYYVAYLVMNSEINERFNPTRILKDSFYPLTHADYPSIVKPYKDPSWLDTGNVRKMEASRMSSEGRLCGRMTDRDLDLVLRTIAESPLVSNKIKKEIGLI